MIVSRFLRHSQMARAVLLSSMLSLVMGAQAWAQGGPSGDGPPPAQVRVAEAQVAEMAPQTWVAGTVVSRSDARLAAEVAGRMLSVAEVGTVVVAGDEIAVIEDTALRLREAELSAEVSRVEARLVYLKGEAERQQRLAKNNLAAESALALTVADRNAMQSELAVARSRLEQMQDQIERTRMRAPFDGVVVERLINPGERVSSGDSVVRMIDNQSLEVVARAPLDYLPHVRVGEELTLQSAGKRGAGDVRTVVALGNQNVHVFEVRLDVPANAYAAGQTVRVSIPTSTSQQVLAVPRDALVLRSDGISVFVIDDDMTARQVQVITGVGNEENIAVEGDINPGSKVVIRGNERLRPGQNVVLLEG
ncbi:MAG: efflux RND transporter periplasmic adaptor subunit [Xanthomonadales bacterium]|nr:efflux RND transporter periplasmic adaptor subunit [Xanthomonadales bacterium]